MLVDFYETQKRRFAAKELDAAKVAGAGEGRSDRAGGVDRGRPRAAESG